MRHPSTRKVRDSDPPSAFAGEPENERRHGPSTDKDLRFVSPPQTAQKSSESTSSRKVIGDGAISRSDSKTFKRDNTSLRSQCSCRCQEQEKGQGNGVHVNDLGGYGVHQAAAMSEDRRDPLALAGDEANSRQTREQNSVTDQPPIQIDTSKTRVREGWCDKKGSRTL